MTTFRFSKMHGAGNDYVYIDATSEGVELSPEQIRRVSDRRFGVGGDGVVFLEPPREGGDLRMRMHNADGSEGDMCGNAIRCVAKLALDRGLVSRNPLVVETNSGPKSLHCEFDAEGRVTRVRVDMGSPGMRAEHVPVQVDVEIAGDLALAQYAPELDEGRDLRFTALSMGNPHAVFFVEEPTDELVLGLGPRIETHPLFPNRVNVEFVRADARDRLTMRVWERGSGETLACGTGACAALVAAHLTDRVDKRATVSLPGGELDIEWAEHGRVWMTGPAAHVFDGVCDV